MHRIWRAAANEGPVATEANSDRALGFGTGFIYLKKGSVPAILLGPNRQSSFIQRTHKF